MSKKIVVKSCMECPYKMYWVLPLEEPIITCRKLDLEIPQEGIHELCSLEYGCPELEQKIDILIKKWEKILGSEEAYDLVDIFCFIQEFITDLHHIKEN